MSSFQSNILKLIWSPLYEWSQQKLLKVKDRPLSFQQKIDSSTTVLYVVGPDKEMLDKALADIDALKTHCGSCSVYLAVHENNRSHIDEKLFPTLFFYKNSEHYLSKEVKQKLNSAFLSKKDLLICRVSEVTALTKFLIYKSSASIRLFFGEGDFSQWATFSVVDEEEQLFSLFPTLRIHD